MPALLANPCAIMCNSRIDSVESRQGGKTPGARDEKESFLSLGLIYLTFPVIDTTVQHDIALIN